MSNRFSLVLILSIVAATSGGCAQWKRPDFDLSRLRDPRAVDIDDRLSAPPLDARARMGE